MKLFIDSALAAEIKQAFQWKLVEGVTTNPSLMKKAVDAGAARNLKEHIIRILAIAGRTPLSLEVTETTAEGMISQGKKLYELFRPYGNVYIKIPVTPAFRQNDKNLFDGINAIKALSKMGIPVNCTLVFTPEQAYLAAKAGAKLVSPFAGRLDDYLRQKSGINFTKTDYYPAQGAIIKGKLLHDNGLVSGVQMVKACLDVMRKHGFHTKVLAASLRNPLQIAEMRSIGADLATIPFSTIAAMREHPALLPVLSFPPLKRKRKTPEEAVGHPETFAGMKQFTKDIVPEYAGLSL